MTNSGAKKNGVCHRISPEDMPRFSVRRLPIFAFTIVGVYRLNFQVRYGSGCFPTANITVLLAFSFRYRRLSGPFRIRLSFIPHGSSKNKHQLRLTSGYSFTANITVLLAFSFRYRRLSGPFRIRLSFIPHGSSKNKHQLRLTSGYSFCLFLTAGRRAAGIECLLSFLPSLES